MKVTLVSKTENLLDAIYFGARTCYSPNSPVDEKVKPREEKIELVKKVLKSGHTSIAEHANFTFVIEEISRACSHQLVRHRHASYSHQSQRYVRFDNPKYYLPQSILHDREADAIYNRFLDEATKVYRQLVDLGIKPEDARYVLPNATCSNITVTLNLRELIHICGLRLCSRSQLEIRNLVRLMSKEIIDQEDWLKELLVPKCEQLGFCNEFNSCGRMNKTPSNL